jgi:hypothetical protein
MSVLRAVRANLSSTASLRLRPKLEAVNLESGINFKKELKMRKATNGHEKRDGSPDCGPKSAAPFDQNNLPLCEANLALSLGGPNHFTR